MLGQFSRDLDEKMLDNEQPYQWLKFGDIKEETESFCIFTLLNMQKTRLQNDSQMVYTCAQYVNMKMWQYFVIQQETQIEKSWQIGQV